MDGTPYNKKIVTDNTHRDRIRLNRIIDQRYAYALRQLV